ncbi:hypothetical protein [Shewanella sp. AC34-MNA-CIBAN-0136]|uniref:hypothetical protein n=1 Tax=Shewanella sp. AC34-MNA-CIBAN-0136 TaxID=3140463 RepID=UPI00332A93B5
MARKKGTDLELVVAAIEKALDPDSIVKHDQHLPVLTSIEGYKRQCDVVIYSGSERRPMLTIVEVQDRNSSVSIGTYDGWVSKRDEVGANHLICVSRKPFSKSILEKAKQQGSRVSLIELAAGIPDKLPLGFINIYYQYVNLMVIGELIVVVMIPMSYKDKISPDELTSISQIEWKKKSFKNSDAEDISIHDALLDVFKNIHLEENTIHTSSCCVSFLQNKELILFVDTMEHKIPILLKVELNNYKYECNNFPMDVAVYRTNGKGDYGWFFEANHKSAQGPISIKIPIISHEESGGYMMLDIISDSPFKFTYELTPIEK